MTIQKGRRQGEIRTEAERDNIGMDKIIQKIDKYTGGVCYYGKKKGDNKGKWNYRKYGDNKGVGLYDFGKKNNF